MNTRLPTPFQDFQPAIISKRSVISLWLLFVLLLRTACSVVLYSIQFNESSFVLHHSDLLIEDVETSHLCVFSWRIKSALGIFSIVSKHMIKGPHLWKTTKNCKEGHIVCLYHGELIDPDESQRGVAAKVETGNPSWKPKKKEQTQQLFPSCTSLQAAFSNYDLLTFGHLKRQGFQFQSFHRLDSGTRLGRLSPLDNDKQYRHGAALSLNGQNLLLQSGRRSASNLWYFSNQTH